MNQESGVVTFCGRVFTAQEVELMGEVAGDYAALGVTEIARTICELLAWKRPSGGLKNHECRQLLERLQDQGVLALPAVRALGRRGPRRTEPSAHSDPRPPVEGTVADLAPLQLTVVDSVHRQENKLWREFLERYHYLGYRVPVGAHLRYWVRAVDEQILACLQWTSPAWKMAARDQWIGWSPERRASNLQYIVSNSRFLILPWVRVKSLASAILARCARQLPQDWQQRYGYRPLLLETLVDAERFAGTCYRAANWIHLGHTAGRGRMDRYHQADGQAAKLIFAYPLCRRAQQQLCLNDPPPVPTSDE